MRPNSPYQHRLLNMFRGRDSLVFILEKGTALPDDLILVHERTDHWSMQPANEMSLEALNIKMSTFFKTCPSISIPEWFARYPKPTEYLSR